MNIRGFLIHDRGASPGGPERTRVTSPRPDARRRQIIDAARQLISECGDAAISTADVAKAAGVTRALVHHYFRGIDELLDAAIQQLVASLARGSLGAITEIPVQQWVPPQCRGLPRHDRGQPRRLARGNRRQQRRRDRRHPVGTAMPGRLRSLQLNDCPPLAVGRSQPPRRPARPHRHPPAPAARNHPRPLSTDGPADNLRPAAWHRSDCGRELWPVPDPDILRALVNECLSL